MNRIIKEDIQKLTEHDYNTEILRDKTLLIVGANSLIAKYLTYLILKLSIKKQLNCKVAVLVRNLDKAKINFADYLDKDYFQMIHQDVCDPIKYEEPVDFIFHAGGSSSPYFYLNDPVGIIKANAVGTINVLDFAIKRSVQNVVFASTREVYGATGPGVKLIKETDVGNMDQLALRNCYPESKKLAESAFVAYAKQYGIPYTLLRIASAYGPGMILKNDGRAIADLVSAVTEDKDIVLTSAGTVVRGYCYISDITHGIMLALLNGGKNQVFNLSNETELLPLRDIAAKLVTLHPEKGLNVIFSNPDDSELKGAYNTVPFVPMDTGRIEAIGWTPKVNLDEGLRRTVLYYKNGQGS